MEVTRWEAKLICSTCHAPCIPLCQIVESGEIDDTIMEMVGMVSNYGCETCKNRFSHPGKFSVFLVPVLLEPPILPRRSGLYESDEALHIVHLGIDAKGKVFLAPNE